MFGRSGKAAHRWVVCNDVAVTAEEIHERFMALLLPTTMMQARHRYVAALNATIDRIEAGDCIAARELKVELDEMQLVLDQSYEWV